MTLVEHRIAGERVAGTRAIDVENPATAQAVRQVGLADRDQVQRTIAAAQAALPSWRDTPAAKRAQVMFRFKQLLEQNEGNTADGGDAKADKVPVEQIDHQMREWTGKNGSSFKAKFIEASRSKVVLELENGRKRSYNKRSFSEEDVAYIEKYAD